MVLKIACGHGFFKILFFLNVRNVCYREFKILTPPQDTKRERVAPQLTNQPLQLMNTKHTA